ncbi:uncharacterized protein [Typha angustifolia]|uniref:uncharacterized protein n=1 Tax=Typha angustifolia TaxID=59011 RepID=UPI003C30ADC2
MALKRYVRRIWCVPRYPQRETKRKKGVDEAVSVELSTVSSVYQKEKDSVVRIVLAGGIVELYSGAVLAYSVMKKYPGLCLARPEVFKRPHVSIVSAKEKLLPGQKFYLIPKTTVKKLERKVPNGSNVGDSEVRAKEVVSTMVPKEEEEGEEDGVQSDDSICSAKDFYVSNEKWSACFLKRLARRDQQQQEQKKKNAFMPPMKSVIRSRKGILSG